MDNDKLYIAVDPGGNGAFAWAGIDKDGKRFVNTSRMPNSPQEIHAEFKRIYLQELQTNPGVLPVTYVMEDVGSYRSGNSGPAAVKFARNCGRLDMLSWGYLNTKLIVVPPKRWMIWICNGQVPPDKTERKNKIKGLMQGRYPLLNITLAESDALGILTWAMEKQI